MIDIKDANVGDFVYARLSIQEAPVFAEITRVLDKEGALELFTDNWGNRVVRVENAYWEEKEAKKNKRIKVEHNYKQWIKEMLANEETETDNRIDTIHHGQSKVSEDSRETSGTKSVPKSVKRKQKVVRKSTTRRHNTSRNRKTRTSKK